MSKNLMPRKFERIEGDFETTHSFEKLLGLFEDLLSGLFFKDVRPTVVYRFIPNDTLVNALSQVINQFEKEGRFLSSIWLEKGTKVEVTLKHEKLNVSFLLENRLSSKIEDEIIAARSHVDKLGLIYSRYTKKLNLNFTLKDEVQKERIVHRFENHKNQHGGYDA